MRNKKGAVLVELAVIIPVLVTMVLGAIAYSFAAFDNLRARIGAETLITIYSSLDSELAESERMKIAQSAFEEATGRGLVQYYWRVRAVRVMSDFSGKTEEEIFFDELGGLENIPKGSTAFPKDDGFWDSGFKELSLGEDRIFMVEVFLSRPGFGVIGNEFAFSAQSRISRE